MSINSESGQQLVIRSAVPADTSLVLDLIKQLAAYEKLAHEVVATENQIRDALFDDQHVADVILAELGDKTVGFALYFHTFSTFVGKPGIYLEDLFVVPEERGKGFGKALLEELARIAQSEGCARLEWSVLDWNTPAIEFYKRMGAAPMDEWTVYRLRVDE